MTSNLARLLLAASVTFSTVSLAQNGSHAGAAAPPVAPAEKIGTINMEQVVVATNEGQRDFEALAKKFEPRQAELKSMSDELQSLKKQLSSQADKLNDEANNGLSRQIDQKQKLFDRTMQDARDDFSAQQQEVTQAILQKLAPVLMKYIAANGYGLLIDTSKQWPNGQAIVAPGWNFDVTKGVVEAYNAQSGVVAPKPASATRPAGPAKPAPTPAK